MASEAAPLDQAHVAALGRWLEVRVEDATGSTQQGQNTWDESMTEGFVKVEVRGPHGAKSTKQSTKTVPVTRQYGASGEVKLTWMQPLYLEVTEAATELRLLLCREVDNNGRKSTSVMTACGIFVKDILDAVPIDKYFEMFKPGAGDPGGFLRLRLSLISEEEMQQRKKEQTGTKKRGVLGPIALIAAVVTAAVVAKRKLGERS